MIHKIISKIERENNNSIDLTKNITDYDLNWMIIIFWKSVTPRNFGVVME